MALLLNSPALPRVVVHPVVVLQILDQHSRRNKDQERVFGTLLGEIRTDNTVEVTNCFPVPASVSAESGSLTWGRTEESALHDIFAKCNPAEAFVGWYSTGASVDAVSSRIHSYYKERSVDIVHLQVDCGIENGSLSVRAMIQVSMRLGSGMVPHFVQVPCKVKASAAELLGLRAIRQLGSSGAANGDAQVDPYLQSKPIGGDGASIEDGLLQLREQLRACRAFVDDVRAGRRSGDPSVGRKLVDAVSQLSRVDRAQLQASFGEVMQDVVVVTYLANLTSSLAGILQNVA